MTSEAAVRVGVRRYLRRLKLAGIPLKFISIHGDIYAMGEPDIIGCIGAKMCEPEDAMPCMVGRLFIIELKAPGNTSTILQSTKQKEWEDAGAIVMRDVTTWKQVEERFQKEGIV